jgi:hypothetical protein
VGRVAGGAPEVALLDGDLFAALDADGGALEEDAPLLLGVVVQLPLRVRAMVTTDSMACSPAKMRVESPGPSSRRRPSDGSSRLWNSSFWDMGVGLRGGMDGADPCAARGALKGLGAGLPGDV